MSFSSSWFAASLAMMVSYAGLTVSSLYWAHHRRKTRWPFKPDDKLLRSPGESLQRRIRDLDEAFLLHFVGALFTAAIVTLACAAASAQFRLEGWSQRLFLFGCPAALMVWGVPRTHALYKERSSCFLGWFGERLVAEKLRPLQREGYHVYHDVPADGAKKPFNLDHVVVGPAGVVVVEVKTRRKGNARPGREDHVVNYNGVELDWPWGTEAKSLLQATSSATWLRRWLAERTGLQVEVRAVVTLPGWFVNERVGTSASGASTPVRVVNPAILGHAIRHGGAKPLSDAHVDLICRQLETICRTVSD